MQGEKLLSVGEVARRSGTTVSTLHFYEASGLLSPERSSGNQRRYRRDALRRVAFIRAAQALGISLAEIAVEKGATALLMPVSTRRQLIDLSDEMATKVDIQYYLDARDALLKALLE